MAHRVLITYVAILAAFIAFVIALPSVAQKTPSGSAVLNQGLYSGAITPSDTQALLVPTRAIFNGNNLACNIAMKMVNDSAAVIWQNIQPGELLPVSAIQVMSANTTCSNIVGIW